jgi:hypothetical protein
MFSLLSAGYRGEGTQRPAVVKRSLNSMHSREFLTLNRKNFQL